jgi:hypothetical protein
MERPVDDTFNRPIQISYRLQFVGVDVIKIKVKVTLVQALRLCTGRTAHRGSRSIALLFHDQRH